MNNNERSKYDNPNYFAETYGLAKDVRSERTAAVLLWVLSIEWKAQKDKELASKYMKENLYLTFAEASKDQSEGFGIFFSQLPPFLQDQPNANNKFWSVEEIQKLDPDGEQFTTIWQYLHHLMGTYNIDKVSFGWATQKRVGVCIHYQPSEILDILK